MELENIALKAFQEAFTGYQYPFESSDRILESKDTGARAYYYEKAQTLVNDEVLKQELTEFKRSLYAKLALQSMTDIERTAYRVTLLAVNNFEKRLQALADRVKSLPMKPVADSL